MAKGAEYNYSVDKIPSEELPGLSAFIQDEEGKVFHTYSSYARGLDTLVGTYNFLDMAPKGRDEGACPGRWPGCVGTTNIKTSRKTAAAVTN